MYVVRQERQEMGGVYILKLQCGELEGRDKRP